MGASRRRPKVLLIVAHPGIGAGLETLLRIEGRYEVRRIARLADAATLAGWHADLALVDGMLLAGSTMTDLGLPALVLSGDAEDGHSLAAKLDQSRGWLRKDATAHELADALDRVLGQDRTVAQDRFDVPARGSGAGRPDRRSWAITFALAAVAFRLVYLVFGTTDRLLVGWYIDSFHHWQIAYFTKEIGVFNGPRLWDLGGQEYFWGFWPTVIDVGALAAGFSNALWPIQLVNIVCGSAIVAVLYLTGRKYASHRAGVILAVFFAVSPQSVMTDASGMQEPVALLFLSLALYWLIDRPFLAGVFLGLAAASRADYWLYSLGILTSVSVARRMFRRAPPYLDLGALSPYLRGYGLALAPYVLHLWLQTGNPLYPLYWNFIGNALGDWQGIKPVTPRMMEVRAQWRVILVIAAAAQAAVLWRRPRVWPLLTAGLWCALLFGFYLGVSQAVLGFREFYYLDRGFLLVSLLVATTVGLLIARVGALRSLRRIPIGALGALIVALLLIQLWRPALEFQHEAAVFGEDLTFGSQVAALAQTGTVVVPGDAVVLTYALVQHGLGATRLLSANYHPPYRAGDSTALYEWLTKYHVRWIVTQQNPDPFWASVLAGEADHLELVAEEPPEGKEYLGALLKLYRIRP